MFQIILAILLLIPTICHAQGTRMSNGAAATSGASVLTGIVEEEPPASVCSGTEIFCTYWNGAGTTDASLNDPPDATNEVSGVWTTESGAVYRSDENPSPGYTLPDDTYFGNTYYGFLDGGGYFAKSISAASDLWVTMHFSITKDGETNAALLMRYGTASMVKLVTVADSDANQVGLNLLGKLSGYGGSETAITGGSIADIDIASDYYIKIHYLAKIGGTNGIIEGKLYDSAKSLIHTWSSGTESNASTDKIDYVRPWVGGHCDMAIGYVKVTSTEPNL